MYKNSKIGYIYLLSSILLLQGNLSFSQNTTLQSPEQFLGYTLGSRFTPHYKVVQYFEHLTTAQPTQTKLNRFGWTPEMNQQIAVFISSAQNIAKLEDIRTNNLKITGLQSGQGKTESPAIVWLSYGVHGDESSSTEASMLTAYELLQNTNAKWLENTVVVIDPCLNPDGRDRFVHWYTQQQGNEPNPSLDARENNQTQLRGRYNHYQFDMNRDWAWQTQRETQNRIKLYQQWMPHVHVDFHEMGVESSYYFAPAAEPYHTEITPFQRSFQIEIGKNHAKYFDKNGWLYYTKEQFDLLYPSYGDSYPMFNGAIGMTYEQGGLGKGVKVNTPKGGLLTLADRLTHHKVTGLSTVEVASLNQKRIVTEFKKYFDNAKNPQGQYKTFVISGKNPINKLRELATFLDKHQIKYGIGSSAVKLNGFNYATGKTEAIGLQTNDLVISTVQPQSALVRVFFNPRTALADSLTYDATAWALPYLFGVQAYALAEKINVDESKSPLTSATLPDTQPLAYLCRWESLTDLQLFCKLSKAGIQVRAAEKSFTLDKKVYKEGTLVILRGDNTNLGVDFDRIVKTTAIAMNQALDLAPTGFVDNGVDFGSDFVYKIKPPQIAVLTGTSITSTSFGQIWHYFDEILQYPITTIDLAYFNRIDLNNYDVLILPDGNYPILNTDANLAKLKTRVQGGGNLVAVEGANSLFANHKDFGLKKVVEDPKEADKQPKPLSKDLLKKYGERHRNALTETIQGSIYEVALDSTHPLGFGYPTNYFTLKQSSDVYELFAKDGWNVGSILENNYIDGFAGAKAKKKMKNSLIFGVENVGRGNMIYLLEDPLFRNSWRNGFLLFGNAVFMVGQ